MNSIATITLTATGDLMFCGCLAEQMRAHRDPVWGLQSLGDALQRGDLLFGNLETPISVRQEHEADAPDRYFSPPGVGRALKDYGFDVVNLAHNHIYDFGAEGVEATMQELRGAGLAFVGIGRTADEAAQPVVVRTRGGLPVGFLGYTTANSALDRRHRYVACFPKPERLAREVRQLRESVQTVVVSCHTGAQFNPYPAPEARYLAQVAIAAGAALYLGHHPHVPQGIERIGHGLAVYSLGDFVAPVQNDQTRRTYFVRVSLSGAAALEYECVPCYITDECQTVLAAGTLGPEILTHLEEISRAIQDGSSEALHFATARSRFKSQYLTSWAEELRFGGPRVLWRKIRHLRRYHAQLLWRGIFGGAKAQLRSRL